MYTQRCRMCRRRTAALGRWPVAGRLGRRVRGTCRAASSRDCSRFSATSRLRIWLRESCATARTTGPQRAMTRCFCASESADEARTSKTASTREAVTLACCPPGPEERDVRIWISESGMSMLRPTRKLPVARCPSGGHSAELPTRHVEDLTVDVVRPRRAQEQHGPRRLRGLRRPASLPQLEILRGRHIRQAYCTYRHRPTRLRYRED